MDQNPNVIPYNYVGFCPTLRSDYVHICGGDRVAALVLDYLVLVTSTSMEVSRDNNNGKLQQGDLDLHNDPDRMSNATNGVLTIEEFEHGVLKLIEGGFLSQPSIFTVKVNLNEVRNRIKIEYEG